MYKAILFDMDGTLLHMDQDKLISTYTKLLMGALLPLGAKPDLLLNGFYSGVKAMITNDGTKTNADAFWCELGRLLGGDMAPYEKAADAFYYDGYEKIRELTWENPWARKAVDTAKQKGIRVALATNPVFPRVAQIKRLEWAGFEENNFEIITDYESESFCKPNPKYFLSVCERLGVAPEECLMVGNDASDDMKGASAAGLDCFLVTDCLIETDKYIWDGERGTFEELLEKIKRL